MTTESRNQFINELRSRIKLLEKQQGVSGHQLQEKLLLLLVSESIQQADGPETMLRQMIERTSLILDLPWSAVCEVVDLDLIPFEIYDVKGVERSGEPMLSLDRKILGNLKKGPIVLGEGDEDYKKIKFSEDLAKMPPVLALFPFQSLFVPSGVFVFFGNMDKEYQFFPQSPVIQHLIRFAIEKHEKLKLMGELKDLNHSFDQELARRTEDLQKKLDKTRFQDRKLQENVPPILRKTSEKALEEAALVHSYLRSIGVEIRTPLNGMMGFAELIRDNDLERDKKNKYIDIIKSCGKSLVKIVDDALEYSFIKSGQIHLNKSDFALAPFMSDLYDHYKKDELFRQREKLELRINLNINGATRVFADRNKLMLVLTNLIGNSIKFTDSGHIEFGCTIQEPNSNRSRSKKPDILFFVKDTGIGIEEEHKEKMFQEFYKVEHEISRLFGGLGLGLTISKVLVEMMGGEIWFTSAKDRGTSFFFSLPEAIILSEPDLDQLAENGMQWPPDWKDKKILIVEDDAMSVVYLKEALKSTGAQLMHTGDGKSAVELVSSGIPIDLVLMDIKLPGMSGYEATRQIKAITDIPIIAQTAYAMADDHKKIIQAGCDDYISKPINRKKLLKMINDIFVKGELP